MFGETYIMIAMRCVSHAWIIVLHIRSVHEATETLIQNM